MELYLAIALGLTLGELGKKIIWTTEEQIWKLKHRNDKPSPFARWAMSLDDEEELLEKQKKNPTPCVKAGEWGLLVSMGLLCPLNGYFWAAGKASFGLR